MRLLPLLLLAACAASRGQGPLVVAHATRESGGIRVHFRRMESGTAGHFPDLDAEGGRLVEIAVSPDRLCVGALWLEPRGRLRCTFPYGGAAEIPAQEAEACGETEYVLFEEGDVSVRVRLPTLCALRPAVPLIVEAPAGSTLRFAERRAESVAERMALPLPRDGEGALQEGEWEAVLLTPGGRECRFLLGVDADGTLSATTGFVRKW